MKLQVLTGCLLFNFLACCAGNQADDFLDQALDQELLDQELEVASKLDDNNDNLDDKQLDQDLDQDSQQDDQDDGIESGDDSDFSMPNTLDTLGLDDSGNWVEKRVYWERAEEAYGKLRETNAQVSQEQLQYFAMRNEVDKQLDASRYELGLNESEFTKVLDYLLAILQPEQNQDQNVEQKDDFKITILDNQDQLLLLQTSLKQLIKIDSDLDNVVIKAIDQVQKSNDYERKAWDDFKQIGRVLNDESARDLYYQVASYRKNSKLILNYLKNDLKKSFEELISAMRAKLSQIKKSVAELKDAGIDLKYELKALDHGNMYRKDLASELNVDDDLDTPKEKAKPKNKSGFWPAIIDMLQLLWQMLLWLPKKIIGLFGLKF